MTQRELFSAERARIRHRRGIMGEPVHSKVRRTHGSRFLDVWCSGLHRAYAILHRGRRRNMGREREEDKGRISHIRNATRFHRYAGRKTVRSANYDGKVRQGERKVR